MKSRFFVCGNVLGFAVSVFVCDLGIGIGSIGVAMDVIGSDF